jgi:hypothetical protein
MMSLPRLARKQTTRAFGSLLAPSWSPAASAASRLPSTSYTKSEPIAYFSTAAASPNPSILREPASSIDTIASATAITSRSKSSAATSTYDQSVDVFPSIVIGPDRSIEPQGSFAEAQAQVGTFFTFGMDQSIDISSINGITGVLSLLFYSKW